MRIAKISIVLGIVFSCLVPLSAEGWKVKAVDSDKVDLSKGKVKYLPRYMKVTFLVKSGTVDKVLLVTKIDRKSVSFSKETADGVKTLQVDKKKIKSMTGLLDKSIKKSYESVLKLKPVGFWPLYDAKGTRVIDLSPIANHGKAINVQRDKSSPLLDFRNAFQYIEIPANEVYQSPSFSIGAWVYLRQKPTGGDVRYRFGVQLFGQYKPWGKKDGAQILVRYNAVPVAVTGDKAFGIGDALGNWKWVRYEGPRTGPGVLELHSWQHVLFTYEEGGGRGVLYLNGKEIGSRDNVVYKKSNTPLVAGNNAWWWHQTINGGTGLNGSLRDLVWFDRALSSQEARGLSVDTKPMKTPRKKQASTVYVRTSMYEIDSLSTLPTAVRREVLDKLLTWEDTRLRDLNDILVPILKTELLSHDTRLPATKLLKRLASASANNILKAKIALFVKALNNQSLTQVQRAEAALCLGQVGPSAAEASTKSLISIFHQERKGKENKPTKVEEVLVNACVMALGQIAKNDKKSQALLKKVFELFKVASDKKGNFIKLGATNHDNTAWVGSMEYKGAKYRVGEGRGDYCVEKVSSEQYAEIVRRIPQEYRDKAKEWAKKKSGHLKRVPIFKTMPNGETQKVYLEGENFVLYGKDGKMRGWTIFADKKGYIHVIGGQHNMPNGENYIPSSWEKMSLSRERGDNKYPRVMYWVSKKPNSIDSFEFVGGAKDKRAIPVTYLNYMVIRKGPEGKVLMFGRTDNYGHQAWGAFIYDADKKRWRSIGGDPWNMYENALKTDPKWEYYAPRERLPAGRLIQVRSKKMLMSQDKGNGQIQLAWAWNPNFYQFCRDRWGIRFDMTGRIHLRMTLFGLQEKAYYSYDDLYAYSDDDGRSFFRADGSSVKLPLTVNPAPEFNADVTRNSNGQWLHLWLDMLRLAGVHSSNGHGLLKSLAVPIQK